MTAAVVPSEAQRAERRDLLSIASVSRMEARPLDYASLRSGRRSEEQFAP